MKQVITKNCEYCPMKADCKSYRFHKLGEWERRQMAYHAKKAQARKERKYGQAEKE